MIRENPLITEENPSVIARKHRFTEESRGRTLAIRENPLITEENPW